MLNMNSPTVQNLMQSGFNPYTNSGYVPQQQQQMIYQPNYYNPYATEQPVVKNVIDDWEYSYDPMPKVIVNEARGINTSPVQSYGTSMNNPTPYYNNQAFSGYMNPFLINNQIENEKIRQREMAIEQGRIWRALLKNEVAENDDFDIDGAITNIESLYYNEPVQQELSMKQKIIRDKNQHIAQLSATLEEYERRNIPIVDNRAMRYNYVCNYYNKINSVIGDIENCDLVDYFTRVYPELKQEQLLYEAERFNRNLKNTYNNNDFNRLVDNEAKGRPDSYYQKLMETFADDGVRLETSNGLIITADEMEVKLPARLLKNQRDMYLEQKRKFYDAIFKKEG